MELYQKHPVYGFTRLTTTADGLRVERRRLTSYHYTEIPYEDLLPVRAEIKLSFPLLLSFFVVFAIIGSWVQELDKLFPSDERFRLMTFVTPLVAGLAYFTYTRWQSAFRIITAENVVSLAAQPATRADLLQFVEDLQAHAKSYLRARYAHPNMYFSDEAHYPRYSWLYEHKVISLEEYQQFVATARWPAQT